MYSSQLLVPPSKLHSCQRLRFPKTKPHQQSDYNDFRAYSEAKLRQKYSKLDRNFNANGRQLLLTSKIPCWITKMRFVFGDSSDSVRISIGILWLPRVIVNVRFEKLCSEMIKISFKQRLTINSRSKELGKAVRLLCIVRNETFVLAFGMSSSRSGSGINTVCNSNILQEQPANPETTRKAMSHRRGRMSWWNNMITGIAQITQITNIPVAIVHRQCC